MMMRVTPWLSVTLFGLLATANVRGQCEFFEKQPLTAPVPVAGDEYGSAVAISGNLLVVGAHMNNDECVTPPDCNAGAAYVYLHNGTAWALDCTLTGGVQTKLFGHSVAVDGNTIVVGEEQGLDGTGVYVFTHSTGGCAFDQSLSAVAQDSPDFFGKAVAVKGNVLVVGAPGSPTGSPGQGRGAAHVFRKISGTWQFEQTLTHPTPEDHDQFGLSVDVDGDYLVVGCPRDDVIAPTDPSGDSGIAFVYHHDGSAWSLDQSLIPLQLRKGDLFGWDVAMDGDEVLVGAQTRDLAGKQNNGAAFLFRREAGSWVEKQELIASDVDTRGHLGYSVSLSQGVAMIGGYDSQAGGDGAAYVFHDTDIGWTEVQKLLPGAPNSTSAQFGVAVAVDSGHAVVGAQMEDTNAEVRAGAAYAYDVQDLGLNGSVNGTDATLVACGGKPAARMLLVVVDLFGTPTFLQVLNMAFDGAGMVTHTDMVPAGLVGTITLQSFGMIGPGQLGASNLVTMTFP